jgi:hypothetical protein
MTKISDLRGNVGKKIYFSGWYNGYEVVNFEVSLLAVNRDKDTNGHYVQITFPNSDRIFEASTKEVHIFPRPVGPFTITGVEDGKSMIDVKQRLASSIPTIEVARLMLDTLTKANKNGKYLNTTKFDTIYIQDRNGYVVY